MSESIYQSPNANLDAGEASPLSLKQLLFSFNGRIGRKSYWLAMLGLFVSAFILIFVLALAGMSESAIGIVTLLIYIPLLWISLAVQVKRWHDRDKAGWWVLISFVPLIGPIWALVENGFLSGDEGSNRFGLPPA